MNILKHFEKAHEIEQYLDVLKMGAKRMGDDYTISETFSILRPQVLAHYDEMNKRKEAEEAMKWWVLLSPEEKIKYDY